MVPLLTIAAYEFGEFRLDCSRFALTRNGRPIFRVSIPAQGSSTLRYQIQFE